MKKFYDKASVAEVASGFSVVLDGRDIKTPATKLLVVSSKPLAKAIANEWQGQGEKVDLKTMPLTTLSYAAIDQVADNRALIEGEVGAYASSDLICYRADIPAELRKKEEAVWDPIVAWLKDKYNIDLILITGISHVEQGHDTKEFISKYLGDCDHFALAAMQRLTGLLGSIFLSIAIDKKQITVEQAWAASRVDEIYQAELWGEDTESLGEIEAKYAHFCAASQFLSLIRT